jgi:transcriptional regulator with XRE-family HTH domain
MKYHNIHIGERIRQKFEESNLTISEFAKNIRCSRAHVYNIFKSKSIDIDKLIVISEITNYDFLDEYMIKGIVVDNVQVVLDIEFKNGKYSVTQIKESTNSVKNFDINV